MNGAGPFYFKGNKIGILIIHGGGGGTCADLKPLAEDIYKAKGYTINVPLLPGFGTCPKDLKCVSINSWKIALEKEILLLNEMCERIFIGGHSNGGLLTLILASKYSFDGIFTIGAATGIRKFLFKLVPFFKLVIKYHSIDTERYKAETNGTWVRYDRLPLNTATKTKKLMKEMKKSLKKVFCPALLFQGRLDSDIKAKSMDFIFENINSGNKRKIWLENSAHPILNCPDHQKIVLELVNFISEICN